MAKLTKLGDDCPDGRTCPAVYSVGDEDAYVVQGWIIADEEELSELKLPSGETAVKIPASLMKVLRGADSI